MITSNYFINIYNPLIKLFFQGQLYEFSILIIVIIAPMDKLNSMMTKFKNKESTSKKAKTPSPIKKNKTVLDNKLANAKLDVIIGNRTNNFASNIKQKNNVLNTTSKSIKFTEIKKNIPKQNSKDIAKNSNTNKEFLNKTRFKMKNIIAFKKETGNKANATQTPDKLLG